MTLMTLDTHDTLMVKPKNFKHFLTKSSKKNSILYAEKFVPLQCRKKDGKMGARAAKIWFQACQNLLPAQSVKNSVRKSTK